MGDGDPRLPRRSVLMASLTLAGCAAGGRPDVVTVPAPSSATATRVPETTPSSSPATQTVTAEPSPMPSRVEIIDRYARHSPQQWGTAVTGVLSNLRDLGRAPDPQRPTVALTFDACGGGGGGNGFDADLIDLLRRLGVPATLYLNSRWIRSHESLAAELAVDGLFHIACHGNAHVPLSVTGRDAYGIRGTGSVGAAYDELTGNVDWFVEHAGYPQSTFRPGTAHCDEIGAAIARDLGMPVAGFSVNGDGGATFSASMVEQTLLAVSDGDIVLAHMNRPSGGTARGCARAIPRLLDQGATFVTLADTA